MQNHWVTRRGLDNWVLYGKIKNTNKLHHFQILVIMNKYIIFDLQTTPLNIKVKLCLFDLYQ